MPALDPIFKAYDVRGTVPDQLDEDVARRVGAAFARFAADDGRERGEPVDRVLVARDMRPTGEGLSRARPVGQDTGLARIKADADAGVPAGDHTGTTSSQDLLVAYAEHVRSF